MINSINNILSFTDNSIQTNNNIYTLDNSNNTFAEMLDNVNQELYSQSISNKTVEKKEEINHNNENTITDNKISSEKNTEKSDKINDDKIISSENDMIEENTEETQNTEKSKISDKENNDTENLDNKKIEDSSKETEKKIQSHNNILLLKNKAKTLIDKTALTIENHKEDKKAQQIDKNVNKEENVKELFIAMKDIDELKEELENINLEELQEEDKKEIIDLITALESLKQIILEDSKNDEKVKIENSDSIEMDLVKSDKKETKENINSNEEKIDSITTEETTVEINNSQNMIDNDSEVMDKKEMRLQESKENSSLNNTISDDKGSGELTIINMKDSAGEANLKGYNHYNNISKAQNSNNAAENMIKFQDLMSKLVEKAQVAINNGKSEVLMSLNPEYLGKIRLKISMDGDNNLVGKIFVDNAEIKDIFTKNLDTVISSLNEIGINIEGFDVMLRDDMAGEEGFGFERNNNNGFDGIGNEEIEEDNINIQTYSIVPERKLNLLI